MNEEEFAAYPNDTEAVDTTEEQLPVEEPQAPAQYATARELGIPYTEPDPYLVAAVAMTESSVDWDDPTSLERARLMRGTSGEIGVMQLMPLTVDRFKVADPTNAEQNIAAGAQLLGNELAVWKGNVPLALAAYNGGDGFVREDLSSGRKHGTLRNQAYVNKVLANYDKAKARGGVAQEEQSPFLGAGADDDPEQQSATSKDDFKIALLDSVNQPSFNELEPEAQLKTVQDLWASRKWDRGAEKLLKAAIDPIWEALPEKPNFRQNADEYFSLVKGENAQDIQKTKARALEKLKTSLRSEGTSPALFGSQLEKAFDEYALSEIERVDTKNRGVLGSIAKVPGQFARGVVEGYTSALAAPADLLGYEETGKTIRESPSKAFGAPREFDYEVDNDGNVAIDPLTNEPVTRYRGMAIRGVGQFAGLLAGGALLKGAGLGIRGVKAAVGGVNAFAAGDMAYAEADQEGADREGKVKAALVGMGVGAVAGYVDATIVAHPNLSWLKSLNNTNKTKVMAYLTTRGALQGSLGNVVNEAGIAGGVSLATDENKFTKERLGMAALIGAVPGAGFGYMEGRNLKLPPPPKPFTPGPEKLGTYYGPATPPRPGVEHIPAQYETPAGPEQQRLIEYQPEQGLKQLSAPDSTIYAGQQVEPKLAEELATRLQDFQKSKDSYLVLDLPAGKEVPPELVGMLGYEARRLTDQQVAILKKETYVAPKIDTADIDAVATRIKEVSDGLESSPRPEDHPDLVARRSAIKQQLRVLGEEAGVTRPESKYVFGDNYEARRNELVAKIEKNRKNLRTAKDPQYKQALEESYAQLSDQLDAIDQNLMSAKGGEQAVALRTELRSVNDSLTKLQDVHYVNNLKAQERELSSLLQDHSSLVKQRGTFVEQERFKEIAVKVPTNKGNKFIVPYDDKWYVFGEDGKLQTTGHEMYQDAANAAKRADFVPRQDKPFHLPTTEARAAEIKSRIGDLVSMSEKATTQRARKNIDTELKALRQELADLPETQAPIGEGLKVQRPTVFDEAGNLREVLPPAEKMGTTEAPKPVKPPKPTKTPKGKRGKRARGKSADSEGALPVDDGTEAGMMTDRDNKRLPFSAYSVDRLGPEKKPRIPVKPEFKKAPILATESDAPVLQKSLRRAARDILRTVGKSIRDVSMGGIMRPGIAGYYNYIKDYIRVGRSNNFPTLLHEVSHYVDNHTLSHWDSSGESTYDMLKPEVRQGLIDTADTYYQANLSGDSRKISEGFATFLQMYSRGDKVHSAVLDWFNTDYRSQFPDQWKTMTDFIQLSHAYKNQTPEQYAKSFRSAQDPTAAEKMLHGASVMEAHWIDRHAPIKKLGEDVYDVARRASHKAAPIAQHIVQRELVDLDGNRYGSGRSLDSVVQIAKEAGKYDEFVDYITYKNALHNYYDQGLDSGIAVTDLFSRIKHLEANEPTAVALAHDWWNIQDEFLDMISESSEPGRMAVNHVREVNLARSGTRHGYYSPFVREGKPGVEIGTARTGSLRPIKDPVLEMGNVIQDWVDRALKVRVRERIFDVASSDSPTGVWAREVKDARVKRELRKQMDAEVIDALREEGTLSDREIAERTLGFFKPEMSKSKASEGYTYYARSTPEGTKFYEIANNIHEALQDKLPAALSHPALQLWHNMGSLFKIGATTLRPKFLMQNMGARDPMTIWRNSSSWNPFAVAYDILHGHIDTLASKAGVQHANDWSAMVNRLGLNHSTYAGSELYANKVKATGWKVVDMSGQALTKMVDVVSFGEQGGRTGALITKAKERGLNPNSKLTPEDAIELSLAYQRSSTDFDVSGSKARVINMFSPFFTARIAEVNQLRTQAYKNPAKIAATAATWLAYGIWEELANKDEDWKKEQSPDERMDAVFIPVEKDGEKRLLKWRLGTEEGSAKLIGNAIGAQFIEKDALSPSAYEFAAAFIKGNFPLGISLNSKQDFLVSLSGLGGPLTGEPVKLLANRDPYFRKDIVPPGLVDKPAAQQYTAYTTELAKAVGAAINESPIKIEHLIRGLAPVALDMANYAEKVYGVQKPALTAGQQRVDPLNTLQEAFLRYGTRSSMANRSSEKFYDILAAFSANRDMETPEEEKARKRIDKIHTDLSAINTVIAIGPDAEMRDRLYAKKKELFNEAFEIAQNNKNVARTGGVPKAEAKRIRKEQSKERKEGLAEGKTETVFDQLKD